MKAYGTGAGDKKFECCDLRNGCGHRKANKNRDRTIKKRARQKAKKNLDKE